jgi:CDP-glycerol glycerophosphotransferase (TagB/SpsB family)
MNNLPKIIAKKENFNNFEIIEKTDNLQLIDNVDVVITSHSSMGIEAIIRKKPLISLSFKELDKFNFYKEIIPKRVVYSEAGLKDNLVEAIKNNGFPEEKKVIKDNFNYVDGRDSKRIMDFMKKVMKNQIFSNKNAMS